MVLYIVPLRCMDIREKIRGMIEEAGFSIRELSEKSGVRRASITTFLKGGNLHLRNLEKLLSSLGCTLEPIKTKKALSRSLVRERIHTSNKRLDELCRKHNIQHLAVFGSVLRDDFRADSDIDVLIRLESDVSFFELMDIEEELKSVFDTEHKIDLVTEQALSPLIREEIADTYEVLYDEAA